MAWQVPPWHYLAAIADPAMSDAHASFDLVLKPDDGGFPAVRIGFMEDPPADVAFFRDITIHGAIDVLLKGNGDCEVVARGLGAIFLHPPVPADGARPAHVDLWWYHDWWEIDLDHVAQAFGPALKPSGRSQRFFIAFYSSSGRISSFDLRDLGSASEPAKQDKAKDF